MVGALSYIGVSNVRNAFYADSSDMAFYKTLATAGVKFDFIAPSDLPNQGQAGINAFVAGLEALAAAKPNAVMFIEGANEVNLEPVSFNGYNNLAGATAFQQALFQAIRSDTSLHGVPVANVSVGYSNAATYSSLTGTTGYFDLSNIHAYNTTQANILDTMRGAVDSASPLGTDKPFVITETGYTTDPNFNTLGVDEATQAKLTIDTLLDAFAAGSQKTFLYELFDNYQQPDKPELDHHWGLFHEDGSPKLAATALHNLTALLSSNGGGAMQGTFQVAGLGADSHSLSLTKASGATDLMVWRDTPIWDDATHSAKSLQPEPVTINFSAIQPHVYVYSPVDGMTPIAVYTNVSSITLSLADSALMIELGASQPISTAPPASAPTVTMDAETLVATLAILAQTDGISHVELTGAHVLQMISVQSMGDIVAKYGSVLSKVDGGFNFEVDSIGNNWKNISLYNENGQIATATNWTYAASGAAKTMSITNPDHSGEWNNYGLTGQSYTADHYVYAAGGVLRSVARYHADGTLDSTVAYNPDGSQVVDTYDAGGHKTQELVSAANGDRSTLSYDATGHQTLRQDVSAGGVVTNWTYAASGAAKTMSITNPDHSGEWNNYGLTGQSYTADHYVYAAGGVLRSVARYHADGTLDSTVAYNPDGSQVVDTYDAGGHKTQELVSAANGDRSTLSYDATGHQTLRQDVSAGGVVTNWTYAASGAAKTMSITNPDHSGEWNNYGLTGQSYTADHYVYAAGGVLRSVARYHADGTLDSTVAYNPDGSQVVDTYDAGGHKTQELVSAANGDRSTLSYDATGHQTLRQDVSAGGVVTNWTYAASGAAKTMSITNPDHSGEWNNYGLTGQSYTADHYVYAAGGVLRSVARYHADGTLDSTVAYNPDGSQVVDTYDAGGHKTQELVSAANGDRSTLSYDATGHQTLRQDVSAGGVVTNWTYAASGAAKTMSITNPDHSGEWNNYGLTGQSYTADHYVYAAGDVLRSVARYHADGTLDSTVAYNPDGSQVVDTYDAGGHKTQELVSAANGDRSTLSYDATGHQTLRQDVSAGGVVTNWTYAASGAAKTMSITNPDHSGEWNNYGLTGQSYTADHYVYAAGDVLRSVARYHADGTLDSTVAYNPDGSQVVDTYDAGGHKTQELVSAANGDRSTLSYDATGHQTLRQDVSAGGVVTNWTYAASGAAKTMSITNPDHSGEWNNYGLTGQSYTADHYVYAAGGVLRSVARYHADGTLDSTVAYNPDGSQVVDTYDAGGHKTQELVSAANGDRSTLSYDATGHQTLRQDVSAGGVVTNWTYAASGAAKTMSITNPDHSGEWNNYGLTGQSYTADHYVYAAGGVLRSVARYHADGTLDSTVAYNPDGSQVVDTYDAGGHKTQELVSAANGDRSTLSYDATGHQTLRQDVSAGGVVTNWTYAASGAAKTMSITNPDHSGEWNNYGLTGQSYTADHYVYAAGDVLRSVARYHADGTLDSTVRYATNAGTVVDLYDAIGHRTQEVATGGTGADRFVMSYGVDDRVVAFNYGEGDKIDLSQIDAVSTNAAATLDHFALVPGQLIGGAGQLIVVEDKSYLDGMHWLIQGDTDGNAQADFLLHITTTSSHTPTASDFIFG